MPTLLVVGAGLFGSQAAAYARSKGIDVLVFDPGLAGAASPAAAGLFKEEWAAPKLREHFRRALPLLDQLYGIRKVSLTQDDGTPETLLWVPPGSVLERNTVRQEVTSIGDGWLQTAEKRYEGWVYVAAGVWSERFAPGLGVYGKAGAAFEFQGERQGRLTTLTPGRQAVAFVRDPGRTYFNDGTAERDYADEHHRQSLARAAAIGLSDPPVRRLFGVRPYAPDGPLFKQLGDRLWLATGGRKMGAILGASLARRLVEEELAKSRAG